VRAAEPGRGSVFSASQQQAAWESPAQHALVALLALSVEQADASPATDSIPMIAARMMEGSQRQE
jgi:hypothetical protein